MQNFIFKKLRSFIARKLVPVRRKLERFVNSHWYDWPFGREPLATRDEYICLSEEARMQNYG